MELIKIDNNEVALAEDMVKHIANLEVKKKALEDEEKEMKQQLLEAMEKYGVNQIKNDAFTVSYTAEHVSNRLDTKALQKDFSSICEQYMKETPVKSSIKITVNYKNLLKDAIGGEHE